MLSGVALKSGEYKELDGKNESVKFQNTTIVA